jgi:hypothetical protein
LSTVEQNDQGQHWSLASATTLDARLFEQLAMLLFRHPLATLLDDRTHYVRPLDLLTDSVVGARLLAPEPIYSDEYGMLPVPEGWARIITEPASRNRPGSRTRRRTRDWSRKAGGSGLNKPRNSRLVEKSRWKRPEQAAELASGRETQVEPAVRATKSRAWSRNAAERGLGGRGVDD